MARTSTSSGGGGRYQVAIRGQGRAGRALSRSLTGSGARVTSIPRRLSIGRRDFDLLVVAVPDRLIEKEARRLSRAGFRGGLAIHLSGALGADALRALLDSGTPTASFHPLRSFSGRRNENFAGCVLALEGSERSVRLARRVARRIKARGWR